MATRSSPRPRRNVRSFSLVYYFTIFTSAANGHPWQPTTMPEAHTKKSEDEISEDRICLMGLIFLLALLSVKTDVNMQI
ncbi:hypothetical protein I3842_13G150600 [Carya illinoinensis]|uniref:Uncharacterized protein n=1 Tax=Carya illinoinensis TaxID=32201 RepID=A0A922DDW1_CARIL|nr:hypothetical protein I3842_13G150600 [Carya illinoinensis]